MSRIETRESVVSFIYQAGFRKESVDEQIDLFIDKNPEVSEDEAFFREISYGVIEHKDVLDEKISSFLRDWTIDRISNLDRIILEVAVYEILYRDDIATSVSINEAVKLAKKYGGSDESYSYINGVLSSFEKSL